MGRKLRNLLLSARSPDLALTAARLTGLAALLWGASQGKAPGTSGQHLAVLVLMILSGLAWTGWMLARHLEAPSYVVWLFLAALAGAGGALGAIDPVGFGLVAVAGIGAAIAFNIRTAARVTVIGVASILSVAIATHQTYDVPIEGAVSAVAGLAIGASRRQYVERARQAENLLLERVRADAERDRAAALAERNRIGREIHDVLAHSLGALAVQLDAADATLESGGDVARARQMLHQARELAVQGLRETREAVHVLREEPVELAEQLQALAAHDNADLVVTGRPRQLSPAAGLALYRAAQEAMSNARKHAPGSEVSLSLEFWATATVVTVRNGAAGSGGPDPGLATTGGGYGLNGMRERVESLGGTVLAGPSRSGFTVQVEVPA